MWNNGLVKFICAVTASVILLLGVVLWQYFDALSLEEGVVVDKTHTDEWAQTTYMKVNDVTIPQTTVYPEDWSVTIEGTDPEGEFKRRTVSVSCETYGSLVLGQSWRVR